MPTTAEAANALRATLIRALDRCTRLCEQFETGGLMSDRAVEIAAELDEHLLRAEIERRRIMEAHPVQGLKPASESLPRTLNIHGREVPILGPVNERDAPQSAGGKARAAALSPERRSEIAASAARARWGVDPNGTEPSA